MQPIWELRHRRRNLHAWRLLRLSERAPFGFFSQYAPQDLKDFKCEYHLGTKDMEYSVGEGTASQAVECWAGLLGRPAKELRITPMFCSMQVAELIPDDGSQPLLRVVPLYPRCKVSFHFLGESPDAGVLRRAQSSFSTFLGEGLAVADGRLRRGGELLPWTAVGTPWPNQIPAGKMLKFLNATRYLRAIRDMPCTQASTFSQDD